MAVIGHAATHSFSPAMHNATIEALGIDSCHVVFQGARSFQIWTDTEPPTDVMKQAVVGRFQG